MIMYQVNLGDFIMTDKTKLGLVFAGIVLLFIVQVIVSPAVVATSGDDLRLRVLANSDEEVDQALKRLAVFAIEDFMNQHDDGYTREFLVANLHEIHDVVKWSLADIDVDMELEVSLGYHFFPSSANYYPSLIVRMGAGKGQNWWCFINPGICVVPNADTESANTAQVEITTEVQAGLVGDVLNFVGGLFNNNSVSTRSGNSEHNWFLFADER